MSQAFTGTQHLVGNAINTDTPIAIAIWLTTSGGQSRRFVVNGSSASGSQLYGLYTNVSAADNRLSLFESNSTGTGQDLTAALDVTGNWNHCLGQWASHSSRAIWLNGSNKVSSAAVFNNPTGMDTLSISGRIGDFTGGIAGQAAHAAAWTRGLSDAEAAYIGTGGHPRATKGLASYWKISAVEVSSGVVADQVGTNDLTIVGSTAGTTNPDIESFMIGTALGNLTYTQGTAIASIDLRAGAQFDDVSSAFTVSLCQLNTPTTPTATTSALTAVREVPVGSVTGLVKNNYAKIAGNALPARILAVNVTASTILLDRDQTFASGATVSYYTVNPLTIPGLGFAVTNVFSGTPTSSGVNSLCFFRAKCNNNANLVADTDIGTYTVNASGGGGGGGSGILRISGSYCGGFSGG